MTQKNSLATMSVIGWLIAAGLVICGLLYRTYSISLPSPGLNFSRQLGVVFLAAEVAFVLLALHKGVKFREIYADLDRNIRIALIAFLCVFWWSAFFTSPNTFGSMALTLRWIVHLAFGAAIYGSLSVVPRESISRLIAPVIAALFALSLLTAWHFLSASEGISMGDSPFGWGVAIPGFISGRLFGAFCGAVLAFMLGETWLASNEKRASAWHYLAIILLAGMAIWSGTRAAVFGIICALPIAALFSRTRPNLIFMIGTSACLFVAYMLATSLLPFGDPYFLLFEAKDVSSGNAAMGGRVNLWSSMASLWLEHPLFGAGEGASIWLAPAGVFPHLQPHNAILQFLLSWGLVGTIPALYLLVRAIWHAHQAVLVRPDLMPVLAMLDALLAMAMLDGMLFFPRFIVLIFACIAILLAASRATRTEGGTNMLASPTGIEHSAVGSAAVPGPLRVGR
jgi:O-antigen ligase